MIGVIISLSVSLIASILYVATIDQDKTTKEERDNIPFP